MLEVVTPLVEAGFSLQWLHGRQKRPVESKWSTAPVYSVAELTEKYEDGFNLGARLGEFSQISGKYLHVLDVDIRKPEFAEEAFAALKTLFPDYESFPVVQSGSENASRHFYFLTERPFSSRKLAHSEAKFVDSEGKKHWNWEVELFGTGKQVAIPPSVHPSGGVYRWIREFDFDLVDMGLGPDVPADRITAIASPTTSPAEMDEDDALIAAVRSAPGDFTDEQIRDTLAILPSDYWCEDRDGWLQVGMALHHQFVGAEEGFKLWTDFSKKSTKYDARNQRAVWKSFSKKPGGIRFATLWQAANMERAALDAVEEEDLIGNGPDPNAPKVEDWQSLFARNDEGHPVASLHNASLIVANDPRMTGVPQLNLFTKEVVQRRKPGRAKHRKEGRPKGCKQLEGPIWQVSDPVNGELWSEVRDISVRALLEAPVSQGGYGVKLTDRDLKGAINLTARDHAFHPVREYLAAQAWDGRPRCETLFIDYLGAPDTPYSREVGRLFMIAAVTRVFEPGHKFDFAVILEGLQGKRKTTFIQRLARHWFAELEGDIHDSKAMVELMQGAWILELPELVGFSKADVRTIKAFVSRQTDKVRLAYDRRADVFPRQCVFIGSTNELEYLKDETGGRRFWPIHCEVASIDTDRLEREVDQLWGEAYRLYRTMRKRQPTGVLPLYLADPDAAAEAIRIQESRRVESPEDGVAGRIGVWLDQPVSDEQGFEDMDQPARPRDVTCLVEIWVECLGRDLASYDPMRASSLGRAMRKLEGWTQAVTPRKLPKWGSQRVYVRGDLI